MNGPPWPRSLQLLGYALLLASPLGMLATAVVERRDARQCLAGDEADEGGTALGRDFVGAVRKWWTADRGFKGEEYEALKYSRGVARARREEDEMRPSGAVLLVVQDAGGLCRSLSLPNGAKASLHHSLRFCHAASFPDAAAAPPAAAAGVVPPPPEPEGGGAPGAGRGPVGTGDLLALTHTFSSWQAHAPQATAPPGRGGAGHPKGGKGGGGATQRDEQAAAEGLRELRERERRIGVEINNPYNTKDMDTLFGELEDVKKEIRKTKGVWGWFG